MPQDDFVEIITDAVDSRKLRSWQDEWLQLLHKEISLEELMRKELFLVTDENGVYTVEVRPRDLCHIDGTWHRSVLVLAVGVDGRISVQIRSRDKKFFPLCRESSASGHLGLTAEFADGAVNETEEEMFDGTLILDRKRLKLIGEEGRLTLIHQKKAMELLLFYLG